MAENAKKRIAVVSRDPLFSHFFEWEAEACGCPVRVLTDPPADCSAYDWIILDAAAGVCISNAETCRVAAVWRGALQPALPYADLCWEWPIPVERVRALYEGYEEGRGGAGERRESISAKAIYILSKTEHTVLYRNQTLRLADGEWKLLLELGEAKGAAVKREDLQRLFGGSGNIVEVYVHALRRQLEEPFGIRVIETVRGVGYRLLTSLEPWDLP